MRRVLQAYEELIASGEFRPDGEQARIAAFLDDLAAALHGYAPAPRANGLKKWLGLEKPAAPPPGLYIVGDVGRGKTMLMDLFYEHVSVAPKSRIHFHEFMQNVHARVHYWRTAADDPIPPLAKELADGAALLCFDEFQVSDITDAMILGRLFTALFTHGVVVVATSNVAPDNLYEHGLNRARFLPFIALMKEKLQVVNLNSETDYRLDRIKGHRVYLTPLNREADAVVQQRWRQLTETETGLPLDLEVTGRILRVPQAARGVARFEYSDLCQQHLGPGDFLKIAKTFDTVFVEHIPKLDKSRRNEAKRLVTLIDTLYDNHVRLVASAETAPEQIYPEGDHAFEFGRTVSRLNEMQSSDYLSQHN